MEADQVHTITQRNRYRISTIQNLSEQAYKNKYGMVSFLIGNFSCVAISEPVSAHFVLRSCLEKGQMTLVFRHMVGNGSIFAPERIWRVRRKINALALAPKHINKFVRVYARNSQVLVDKLAVYVGQVRTQDDLKSLLELLIRYSGGYSETELREESLVLLLASIDTTVSVSGFASVLLSQHLDVQDKVYEEIKEVFDDFDQTITINDLNKLKYLEAVLKETMRLYPTTPLIMRKCQTDLKLPSGLVLNEGCQAIINIWGLHRNPKYWGPDADKFRPERFLDATPEQQTAYIPFSTGPRNCAGSRIGIISLKTTLVSILRKYRLKPAASFIYNEQNPLRVKHTLVTKHLDNFQVQLEHRI
ncbi:probable cytochrome P450 313a1 [Nymphalis io]|uniref:probable cytochrome P450 313a1 n=1 Tax=Inachis io TaxID=171585 RepID=UPI002167A85F|nr:probable cytochrome P450 313a1 [Nymphalis io]